MRPKLRLTGHKYLDSAVLAVVLSGLLPTINLMLQLLFFGHSSEFFTRRTYLPAMVSIVCGIAWLIRRGRLRDFFGIVFPANRLGLLSLALTIAYLSQIFFGFWHSGIAGWTYEKYGLERLLVAPAPETDFDGIDLDHRTVILGSFRDNFDSSLPPEIGDGSCWRQEAIVAEGVAVENGDEVTRIVLVTPESLGFVFPNYVLRRDPGKLVDILNARLEGDTIPINWRILQDRFGWNEWRYWSHTPSVGGYLDFSPFLTFTRAERYTVTSCLVRDSIVEIKDIEVVNV